MSDLLSGFFPVFLKYVVTKSLENDGENQIFLQCGFVATWIKSLVLHLPPHIKSRFLLEVPHSTSTNLKENMRNFSLFILASFITLGSTLPQLKSSYRNYQTDRQRVRGTYQDTRNSQAERRRYDEEPKCRIEYDTVYDIEKEEKYEQQCETKYKYVIRK